MSTLKAVVFDSDGTLVNTTMLIREGFKKTLIDFGYGTKATDQIVLENIGKHIPEVFASIIDQDSDSGIVQAMTKHLDAVQDGIASHTIMSYPGEKRVLDELKNMGILLGLFTSGTLYQVRRNFSAVGIDCASVFDAMVTYEDKLPSKPSPDGLLACGGKLGIEMSELIYIGDQTVDIIVGKAANAQMTLGLSHGVHDAQILTRAGADKVIDRLEELLEIIHVLHNNLDS